jgi:peptidoglycan/LPS O-acetylase OafA/YrhL
MTRSIIAVALGVLIALAIGLLVVFGIFAPVFTAFFGMEIATSTAVPTAMLVFAAAFSFYFGGMAASYRAPARRRLHGALVAPAAFVISPLINLATGQGMFPGVENAVTVLLAALFLAVSVAAAYVGARRGEALYAYNRRMRRRAPR